MPSSLVRRLTVVAALGFGLLLGATPSAANGRFPASNQIAFSPADPNVVVARTTYAVLPSRDDGATWTFLCEDSLGLPTNAYQDPELGLTANGALIAGLYFPTAGLDVSNDLGCDWNCVGGPLWQQGVVDVVVRPDTPSVVLALTSTSQPVDAGGGNFSQVFESTDNGANWAALGVAIDPSVLAQTIDVATTDSNRVYVSGTRGYGASRTASLFVSTDGAAHWTEYPLTDFDPTTEDSIYIGAVDPTDADRVYIRSNSLATGGRSRLFVTTDGGNSFQMAKEFDIPNPTVVTGDGELLGFALSPDGSTIYAGTKAAGLFVASRSDLDFHLTSTIHVQCLATRGSELWACSDEVSGFVVGVSTDNGATFCPKLSTITGLSGPAACGTDAGGLLACGAGSNASQCGASFDSFCTAASLTGSCTAVPSTCNTGGPDAGAPLRSDDPPAPTETETTSRGCSAAGGSGPRGLLPPWVLLLLAWGRKRKSRPVNSAAGPMVGGGLRKRLRDQCPLLRGAR